jgi:glutaredoxin-like protein
MISSSKVRLIFFEQSIGCDACAATRRTLRQIADADESVTVETFNFVLDRDKAAEYAVDRVPAVIVAAPDRQPVRYYGAPLGGELPTLVEAIRMTQTSDSGLSDATKARLKSLTAPVRLQVFFTPTCGFCPRMVALANRLAVESPMISSAAVDAAEFPDLVRKYNVNGVPKTVVDDTIEILGAVTEDELVEAVLKAGIRDQGLGIRD